MVVPLPPVLLGDRVEKAQDRGLVSSVRAHELGRWSQIVNITHIRVKLNVAEIAKTSAEGSFGGLSGPCVVHGLSTLPQP